jgi:alpha-amylase/alpha-mannosidase (GH57 family)
MERYICIHGHFYQPPRENAWLEFVELQDSAYPFHDWNERITAECYGPNGMARILDGYNNIEQITNNYSKISFNFGPTLLAWLAEKEPEVYRSILDADRESQSRFSGHGSAIAQSYNHTILPLSNSRDKYTQIFWGVRDFEFRFGRRPEGMWLPETAVDLETLDILDRLGIQFTILSPYQARSVRRPRGRLFRDVNGGRIDPSAAYKVRLPSGRRLPVFFYDGPISQAIAFEHLLDRGEHFADRLVSAFSDGRTWPQLVNIATDGETYGHHHKSGDMALAYALHHIESNNLARLTNYAEYLDRHPPLMEAEIWERSAWSCSHGVERWNSNCGCNSGGHSDWNQEWRHPLREALDWLRDAVAPRFEQRCSELMHDPWAARNDYIDVILSRTQDRRTAFFNAHKTRELTDDETIEVYKLMEMQRHAMLMYTSCGWFFDELSGIETTQVIHYAGRTLQLYEELFGHSLESDFLGRLEQAKSNIPEHRDGKVIYEKFVKPSMIDRRQVAAHYALSSLFKSYPERERIYCYTVERQDAQMNETGRAKLMVGRARIISEITLESDELSFGAVYMGNHSMNAGVSPYHDQPSYDSLKQQLTEPFSRADFAEIIRLFDRHFGEGAYSLRSIFHDDQRQIVDSMIKSTLLEAEAIYRQLYETHAPMMRFLGDLRIPPPRFLQAAGQFALNGALREAFEHLDTIDATRVRALLDEAHEMNVALDGDTLGFTLRRSIQQLSQHLMEDPEDIGIIEHLTHAVSVARELPFEVNVWKAQNNYYSMLQQVFPQFVQKAERQDRMAQEWLTRFVALGRNLSVHVEEPETAQLEKAS